MANIQAFTTALQGGGARANQFEVTMTGGGATGIQSRGFSFLCRSAQIPALTIGEVAVPYRGRQIFLAGDRTYDAWTVTIMNDRSYGIRSQLESWMNNLQDIGNSTSSAVSVDAVVVPPDIPKTPLQGKNPLKPVELTAGEIPSTKPSGSASVPISFKVTELVAAVVILTATPIGMKLEGIPIDDSFPVVAPLAIVIVAVY